jgi:hypothetical protein
LVNIDPLLREVYPVAIAFLATVVLLVTVLLPVDVETLGLPERAVSQVVDLDTVYVLEPDMTAEVFEDCVGTVLYTVIVLVPGANVVVVNMVSVDTASSLPLHMMPPVTAA